MNEREVRRRQLDTAYANAGSGAVAFIDESYQAANPDIPSRVAPFYLMTAYVIPSSDLGLIREQLPVIVDDTYWHSTQAHQHADGRQKIHALAAYIAEGAESIIVSLHSPIVDNDIEAARVACFSALLDAVASGRHCEPVALVLFEERKHTSQRNADERTIKAVRTANLIPRSLRVMPTSPSIERLLWLPDIVSFALYQRHARTGHEYATPFFERVRVITTQK